MQSEMAAFFIYHNIYHYNNEVNTYYNMKKRVRLTESDLHRIVKESVKKVLKEDTSIGSPIEKWNYWCTNFDENFIEKAWADNQIMIKHLSAKFNEAYQRAGSYGAMTYFYLNLDDVQRKVLEDYVMNNYRG